MPMTERRAAWRSLCAPRGRARDAPRRPGGGLPRGTRAAGAAAPPTPVPRPGDAAPAPARASRRGLRPAPGREGRGRRVPARASRTCASRPTATTAPATRATASTGLYGVYHPYFVRGDGNDDGLLDFVRRVRAARLGPGHALVLGRRLLRQSPTARFRPGAFLERDISLADGDLSLDRDAIVVTPGRLRRRRAPLSLGPGQAAPRLRARRRHRGARIASAVADLSASGRARSRSRCRCPCAAASPTPCPTAGPVPRAGHARARAVRRARPDRRRRGCRRRRPAARSRSARSSRCSTTSPSARRSCSRPPRGSPQRFFASTGEVLKSALPARLPASGAVRYRITEKGALGLGAAARPPSARSSSGSPAGEAVRVRRAARARAAQRHAACARLEERGWIRAAGAPRPQRAPDRDSPTTLGPLARRRGRAGARPQPQGTRRARAARVARPPGVGAEIRVATGAGPRSCAALAAEGPRAVLRAGAPRRRIAAPRCARRSSRPRPRRPPRSRRSARRSASAAISRRSSKGVTGSGKTEVYLRAIRAALDAGRGADLARARDRADARLRPGARAPVSRATRRSCTPRSPSASAPRPGTACARERRGP